MCLLFTVIRDVGQPDLASAEPLQYLGNELRSVVHAQRHRRAAGGDETACAARRRGVGR